MTRDEILKELNETRKKKFTVEEIVKMLYPLGVNIHVITNIATLLIPKDEWEKNEVRGETDDTCELDRRVDR